MRQRHPILLRSWRKHRGLTLEQLAERLHMNKGALSRIERGERPYTQDFLEAVADILQCEPVDILIRDPSEPDSVWSIWDRISPPQRDTARRILEQLAQPGEKDKKTG
jgi:transcriptional regulator with XRE-family HTH domain